MKQYNSAKLAILPIACAFVSNQSALCQTLSAYEVLPPIGTILELEIFGFTDSLQIPGTTGVDMNWDYSQYQIGLDPYLRLVQALDPQDTPEGDQFPDASVALRSELPNDTSSVSFNYFRIDPDAIRILGAHLPALPGLFIEVDDDLSYLTGMNIGDGLQDTTCGTLYNGQLLNECVESLAMLVGTGTLILPFAEVQNVKLHVLQRRYLDGPAIGLQVVEANWFVPGLSYPAMNITNIYNNDGTTFQVATVLGGEQIFELGLSESSVIDQFVLSPNPCDDHIICRGSKEEPMRLIVKTITGAIVHAELGTNCSQVVIDTADLPAGSYIVEDLNHPGRFGRFVKL